MSEETRKAAALALDGADDPYVVIDALTAHVLACWEEKYGPEENGVVIRYKPSRDTDARVRGHVRDGDVCRLPGCLYEPGHPGAHSFDERDTPPEPSDEDIIRELYLAEYATSGDAPGLDNINGAKRAAYRRMATAVRRAIEGPWREQIAALRRERDELKQSVVWARNEAAEIQDRLRKERDEANRRKEELFRCFQDHDALVVRLLAMVKDRDHWLSTAGEWLAYGQGECDRLKAKIVELVTGDVRPLPPAPPTPTPQGERKWRDAMHGDGLWCEDMACRDRAHYSERP